MDKVVHFEIPADDVARAQKFYKTAFGWKMNSIPGMGYTLVSTVDSDEKGTPKTPGAINGGMLKRQAPVKVPVITINVANIEKTVQKVVEQGGKLVRKKSKVGDMGYAAYIKDSEGNVVGLWQNLM